MKSLLLSLVGLALLTGPATAQTKADSQEKTKSQNKKSPSAIVVPLSTGTAFNATLTAPLDARRNLPGDTFTAEIKEAVHYQRSVIFPKGTILYGHLVRKSSGGHNPSGSALFVQFDRAVLKNGQEATLNAGVQAIALPPNGKMPPASVLDDAPAPQIRDDAAAERNAAREASLNTDSVAHVVGAVDTTVEDTSVQTFPPPASFPMTQGEFTKNGLFAPDSQGAFGMPEVKVYTPLSAGSIGTVFLSSRKNIHFDPGTRLLIVVQPPRSAASSNASDSIE